MDFQTPANEEERHRLIEHLGLAELASDPVFDEIADAASRLCDAPTALVGLVTDDEQCNLGLCGFDRRSFDRSISFCSHVVDSSEVMIVEDATKDARFRDNPLVTGSPKIRFYAGIPILLDNRVPVGSLCVIDTEPRRLNQSQRAHLMGLLHQVESHLHAAISRRQDTGGDAHPGESGGFENATRRLSQEAHIASFLLRELRMQLAFARADFSAERTARNGTAASSISAEVGQSFDTIDELALSAENVLDGSAERSRGATELSVVDLVNHARGALAPFFNGGSRRLRLDLHSHADEVVGDERLLKRLFTQILTVTLDTSDPHTDLDVAVEREGDNIVTTIRSDGEPPPAELLDSLRTAHRSSDSLAELSSTGSSWPLRELHLCVSIVEYHGGRVELVSQDESKRCLRIELPSASKQDTLEMDEI